MYKNLYLLMILPATVAVADKRTIKCLTAALFSLAFLAIGVVITAFVFASTFKYKGALGKDVKEVLTLA